MLFDLTRRWYSSSFHFITLLLWPFSRLFACCVAIRRWLFRIGVLKTYHFSVPIIIVGNISVGGTGKTPFVIWLSNYLQSQGYHPGIVTRGVGGQKHKQPRIVKLNDVANLVGDEACLLAQQGHCPIVIGIDRVAAVQHLLKNFHCDIVICDDGLQHYRLARDIEIVMIDGVRKLGNQQLLPAGPLREPVSRLQTVDFVIVNSDECDGALTMTLQATTCISLQDKHSTHPLAEFPMKKVHAVAGIGHPERFFAALEAQGFTIIPHIFPDHYLYRAQDFNFNDTLPILMTEKDAVKCTAFADQRFWYVTVNTIVSDHFKSLFLAKLNSLEVDHETEKDFSSRSCHLNRTHQQHDICE